MDIFIGDDIVVKKIKTSQFPLIIWGNGEISLLVRQKLISNNLIFHKVLVDLHDVIDFSETISLEDLNNLYLKYDVICAHLACYKCSQTYSSIFPGCQNFFFFSELYKPHGIENITKKYFDNHIGRFNKVINLLEDRASRLYALAYLNAKIYKDFNYLSSVSNNEMYFFQTPNWDFSD
jgi:hypothetical protein